MRNWLLRLALLAALLYPSGEAQAQELPPPRVVAPEIQPLPPVMMPLYHPPAPMMSPAGRVLPVMPLPPMYYRPSAYQVWQYYGINYYGQFRPRVIQATQGGYFLYRGYPFPYVNVYPGEHFNPIGRE